MVKGAVRCLQEKPLTNQELFHVTQNIMWLHNRNTARLKRNERRLRKILADPEPRPFYVELIYRQVSRLPKKQR